MFRQKIFDAPKMYYIYGEITPNGNHNPVRYETPNAQNGNGVEWSGHVAPIVKLSGSENLYILDPAISDVPVTQPEYDNKFGGQITRHEICNSGANFLRDDCATGESTIAEIKRGKKYEKIERERLLIE